MRAKSAANVLGSDIATSATTWTTRITRLEFVSLIGCVAWLLLAVITGSKVILTALIWVWQRALSHRARHRMPWRSPPPRWGCAAVHQIIATIANAYETAIRYCFGVSTRRRKTAVPYLQWTPLPSGRVESIEGEMDQLLRRLGRAQGPVKNRVEKLGQDLTYANPASDESRAQIMGDIEIILRDAERRAALLFDKTPKTPVIAQPYPRFREANTAASYSIPPADGSRPGIFQFPLRIEMMTKFGLRSIVYHETVPSHHFDAAQQVENKGLPAFRQLGAFTALISTGSGRPGSIPARGEGWGLYAEHLAAEAGWYDNDLEGLLGQLDFELFRARRLVVDTGLHAKHWTRQQAIDYGIEAAEVER
jgi:Bacterial protein of unknown function (DUF885)